MEFTKTLGKDGEQTLNYKQFDARQANGMLTESGRSDGTKRWPSVIISINQTLLMALGFEFLLVSLFVL